MKISFDLKHVDYGQVGTKGSQPIAKKSNDSIKRQLEGLGKWSDRKQWESDSSISEAKIKLKC